MVALGNGLFAQAACLEVFLVKHALGAGEFVVQIQVLLRPNQKESHSRQPQ